MAPFLLTWPAHFLAQAVLPWSPPATVQHSSGRGRVVLQSQQHGGHALSAHPMGICTAMLLTAFGWSAVMILAATMAEWTGDRGLHTVPGLPGLDCCNQASCSCSGVVSTSKAGYCCLGNSELPPKQVVVFG